MVLSLRPTFILEISSATSHRSQNLEITSAIHKAFIFCEIPSRGTLRFNYSALQKFGMRAFLYFTSCFRGESEGKLNRTGLARHLNDN